MKWLTVATLVAAIGSFGILFLSAWALPTDVNLQFTAYWAFFFTLTGALGGLMQETTRAVGAARAGAITRGTVTARPIAVSLAVGAAAFALVAVTGWAWVGLLVDDGIGAATLLLAIGLASFAIQSAVCGLLSGAELWGQYAWLIMLDVVVRLVLAVIAFAAGWGLFAFLLITVIGAASWVVLVAVSPATRSVLMERADVPVGRFTRQMLAAIGAAGASAVLMKGFATVVKLADEHGAGPSPLDAGAATAAEAIAANPHLAAAFVTAPAIAYAVNLTRAPLLMPLEKFQNAIIVHFVRAEGNPLTRLARPLTALTAFGLTGAAVAWAIGPWLLRILPGDYMVTGAGLAALTTGATSTAVLVVTGSVMLATNHHRGYLLGWVVATAVSCAILFGPGLLVWRTATALIVGPILGVALHLRILARPRRAQ